MIREMKASDLANIDQESLFTLVYELMAENQRMKDDSRMLDWLLHTQTVIVAGGAGSVQISARLPYLDDPRDAIRAAMEEYERGIRD